MRSHHTRQGHTMEIESAVSVMLDSESTFTILPENLPAKAEGPSGVTFVEVYRKTVTVGAASSKRLAAATKGVSNLLELARSKGGHVSLV